MAFDKGVSFRATSDYVTDPSNVTYCLDEQYPTTRGGLTFGLVVINATERDRNAGIDVRLAGTHQVGNAVGNARFRIDLPETGDVTVHLAAGDYDSGNQVYANLFDNTTDLGIQIVDTFNNADNFRDILDTNHLSESAWGSDEVGEVFTFATTTLFWEFTPTSGSNNYVICHIRVHIDLIIDQKTFRFYDDGTESGSTALQAADVDISTAKATPFQLRVGAQNDGDPPSQTATLQYKETSDATTEWRDVPN